MRRAPGDLLDQQRETVCSGVVSHLGRLTLGIQSPPEKAPHKPGI